MEIMNQKTAQSGKNSEGRPYSATLELPFFDNEEMDSFYDELKKRIIGRAEREGLSAFSKLCVVQNVADTFSLFIDVLFCCKREVTALYRICDSRKNGFEIPMPKKLKRRGYDCFCIKGNRILAFKNNFQASLGLRRTDYLSVIEQTVI
jgi:hypothetical protein